MSNDEYIFSDESKRSILNHVIEGLRNICDDSYITEVWMDTEGKYAEDFDEFFNTFVPDLEGVMNDYETYRLSKKQSDILKQFYKFFDYFGDHYSEAEEFINTEDWKYIQNQAREVLIVFNEDTIKF